MFIYSLIQILKKLSFCVFTVVVFVIIFTLSQKVPVHLLYLNNTLSCLQISHFSGLYEIIPLVLVLQVPYYWGYISWYGMLSETLHSNHSDKIEMLMSPLNCLDHIVNSQIVAGAITSAAERIRPFYRTGLLYVWDMPIILWFFYFYKYAYIYFTSLFSDLLLYVYLLS